MFQIVTSFLLIYFLVLSVSGERQGMSVNVNDGKSSLAFVFDTTGSMHNDLRQLRDGAEMILNTALKESNVIADFVFVPFHDPAVGPPTVTRNKEVFKRALNLVQVYGGGDCPEKSLTGIQMALDVSRPKSFLYVFTDATAGDHRTVGKVLDTIQRKQSQVVFILTGHCNDLDKPSYQVYTQIAAASSGQIFNLNKASVHKMLEFVRGSIKGRTVNLASVTNPAGYNYTQNIPVDSSLGEVTVSVSGAKPKITVVDPNGEQLTGPPKLVTTLDLSEIMVVKVMQPEPGNYLIKVGSTEDYSVKVVGLSNLTFNHGFSVQKPKSLQETSYRPLKGAYNHMMISLTQVNVTADIKFAEILTLDGRTLFEVPLTKVNDTDKVYVAEPFIPPDDFFYVAINGRDQYNQELRRMGATAIQPKSPEVPYLTVPRQVEAHSHSWVVLTCYAESLVPLSAMWTKDSTRIQEKTTSLQTTSIDYVIEDMSEEHVGTYRCIAQNTAGMSKAITQLTIIVDPPQVTISPQNMTVRAGDSVTITCTVYSEALLLENRLIFTGPHNHYVTDIDKEPNIEATYSYDKTIQVSENNAGMYSCVARNRGGTTKQSTNISLQSDPVAQILGPHTLTKHINSDFQLICGVENAQEIVWHDPNNTEVKRIEVNGTYNDVLDVKNVTSDGVWTCTALGDVKNRSDSVTVNVLIKPVVSIMGAKNMTVLNGTVVEVSCRVVAKPEPRILWHRETETFLDNTITEIQPTIYISVLTLDSSVEPINGTYFCFGENSEGINQDSVTVDVRRKMTVVQGFTDKSVQLYYQIELPCIIDSYPAGVIHWYHNGTSLVPTDNVVLSEDGTTVYLTKVDFTDLGEYKCEVENEYEKVEVKGVVSVEGLAPPMLSKDPASLAALEGRSTIITCRVLQGQPDPTISWQYKTIDSSHFESLPEDAILNIDSTELSISIVSEKHGGIYRCVALNVIGQDVYDVTLLVQYPPKLVKVTEDNDNLLQVKLGDKVRLSCEASGVPPPVTVWTKHGRPLVFTDHLSLTDTSELQIEARSALDSGTYSCDVTNTAGTVSRNFTVTVYDPPKFVKVSEDTDEPLQVKLGDKVKLSCEASGVPAPVTVWTKHGRPLVFTDQLSVTNTSELQIEARSALDSGTYTCDVTNTAGTVSRNFTVTVYDPPKLLNVSEDNAKPLQVKLGDKVKLSCEASGLPAPVTVWTKHGRPLVFTENLSVTNTSELQIEARSAPDSGTYSCDVTNAAGTVSRNFTVTVYDPPKLLNVTENNDKPLQVKLGDKVKLSCESSGVPAPVTVWTKHGRPIVFTEQISVTNTSELQIEARSALDSGTYTCDVTNTAGTVSRNFTVTVYDPPTISSTSDPLQEVLEGQLVELPCTAEGLPTPNIEWTRNGEPIANEKIADGYGLRFVTKLTDTGEYTCTVRNTHGNASVLYTLHVWDPPKLINGTTYVHKPLQVKLGDTVKLSCESSGVPPPATVWTKHGRPIVFTEHISVTNTSELQIEARSALDSGTYTCDVTNTAGTVSRNFTVTVYDPPKLLNVTENNDKPLQVKLGNKVKLSCVASGVPPPVTVWTKHGRPILFTEQISVTNTSELQIEARSALDSGTYTCDVTNTAGAVSRNFTVNVYDPPTIKVTEDNNNQLQVKLGDKVKLSCEASGVPPPVTVWRKHGRPLVFTEQIYLTPSNELQIEARSAQDSGTYTCDVTSTVGSTSKNFTVTAYEPPTISSTSDPLQEVLEGQLVGLPCTARGLPTPYIEWTLNGERISNGKYIVENGLRFVANLTDFGEFTCTARNMYGNTSFTYTLHVWVPPHIVPLTERTKEMLLGLNVTLQCDVIGFPLPSVQWTFNDELLTANTTDVSFNDIGNIYVTNASFNHEGVYTCVAENFGGTDEQSVYVRIIDPPKIIEDNYTGAYIATDIDTVLSVSCRATGKPKPYFLWMKDEFYLNNDPRYSIDLDGTLHIKSPTEDMSGNYTCVARNVVGQANKTVPVEIYSLPSYTQSEESPTTVTVVEGSEAHVECPVRATSRSLKWYKNAKLISTGNLHLHNITRADASTYSCVATNAVGSAHSRVQLVVEWAPRFVTEENGDVERVRGDDCYFHCDVDAKPSAKTRWVYNSKSLVFEDKSQLRLFDVQVHNAGTYKCIVSNAHGTVVKEFKLNVLEPPFISDFDMMDVQLKEGDNATMECNAHGTPTPTVTWTYNNSNWHVKKTSLSAVNISTKYEGLFRCEAANSAGVTHVVYRVTVVCAPRVTEVVAFVGGEGSSVGGTAEVVQGSNIRIACKASGNPVPDIQWVRQGRAVSENRHDIHYADLSLSGVETNQKGFYTCVASNEGGTDSRRIKLDVFEPPKIFQSLFEANNSSEVNIEVISGQSFYLHCHPYGNPLPELYWFKNDVPLKLFDDTMVSTEFGEVIEVKEAIEEQSGNYTCVARNKVGNVSLSYLVDVLVPPPSPKESTKNVTVKLGKQLTLRCPPAGTRPSAMWIKHPYTEVTSDARISLTDDNFTLTINKTIVSDSGKYSCILINRVGTTEVTFDVTVHKRPSIAGNVGANYVEGHVVPLRRSIVLKCEADGHPMPELTWLKDTQELSSTATNIHRVLGNSLLAIWGATVRDAGQYICMAENQAGFAHRRYNIAIQVPAKWSGWSSWSYCNVTCGAGYQTRTRVCHYVDDYNNTYDSSSNSEKIVLDETACKGPREDKLKCQMHPCDLDESTPRWSGWSRWSECSSTCGAGTQARTRRCRARTNKCVGDNVEIKKCAGLPPCNQSADSSSNDVFDSNEDISDSNPYIPEITFESQPEVVNSLYSPDVAEFYNTSGSPSAAVFYEVNVTRNLDGSERGPCAPGYRHNVTANTCDDVDECTIESNACHLTQVCVNTAGAYRCACEQGYLSLAPGQRCLDINECEMDTAACEFACVNTAGGYVCACPKHLRLHVDRHHCVTPSLYRRPYAEIESEYISTTVDFPARYTKGNRNK